MFALISTIIFLATVPPLPNTGTGSQTPAIVGIVIALASAVGWVYSIFRTHRGDRLTDEARREAAEAAARSAAVEANKQSFAQVMDALERSDTERNRLEKRIEDLEGERDAQRGRISELEGDVIRLKAHITTCEEENGRLRELVRMQGMG